MTTASINDTHGLDTLTWADLYAAKFAFNQPFCLPLCDDQAFFSTQVVRLLPKRRIVAFGTWHDKQVVAKLFFDPKKAKRHMEKDIAGIKSLQKCKIPTAELLYEGVTSDKRIYVLIFERIMEAQNLEEVWLEKQSIEEILPVLKSVIIEIATQHVLGLLQHDLHLKNFLLTDKTIFTLDGAQIEVLPTLLAKQASMNNLALFLSQLGVNVEGYQEILFKYYADARGWALKKEDYIELFVLIKKWNDLRWEKYAKKVFRSSTQFARIRRFGTTGIYDRSYKGPEMSLFLSNPESVFNSRTVRLLKSGNSATVIRVKLDGRDYVVKRYNLKNIWHRLRRCLRPTRAATSWRLAQKLNLFDIATARPVAMIENRFLCFRGTSYYVTEYISGQHAGDYFFRNFSNSEKLANMVKHISVLLKSVAKVEITHGDLKITNILVDATEKPVLIDLDGASEHVSLSGLRKAWQKELTRFLQNFSSNPVLREKFEVELGNW